MKLVRLAVVVGLLGAVGCSVDPVTGRSTLVLMSEGQEIALGEQTDEASLAQFGVYEDEALQQWVEARGAEMAAASERPQLPWTFRVLDDDTVNAFAAGGGYVYLTRGILAWANSEAEIVGVLGHEIGHVTARHIPERYTTATLTQVGFAAGMILSPALRTVGGELQQGLGLLMLKFSRDNESESDRLGVRYAATAGYDPRELAGFFTTLDRMVPADQRLPTWASTHPAPASRAADVLAHAEPLVTAADLRVGRDAHLARIDGLVFGPNPREGVLVDRTFKHPDLLFQVDFPSGWRVQNTKTIVVSGAPDQDAVVALTAGSRQGESLRDHATAVLESRGATNVRGENTRVGGLPAVWVAYNATADIGELGVYEIFVDYGDLVYDLFGYALARDFGRYQQTFRDYAESFRELGAGEAERYQPDRLRLIRAPRTARFADLVESNAAADTARLALLNGVAPDTTIEAGTRIKTVAAGYPRQ